MQENPREPQPLIQNKMLGRSCQVNHLPNRASRVGTTLLNIYLTSANELDTKKHMYNTSLLNFNSYWIFLGGGSQMPKFLVV